MSEQMNLPDYLQARVRELRKTRAELIQQVAQIDGALAEVEGLGAKLVTAEPAPAPSPRKGK